MDAILRFAEVRDCVARLPLLIGSGVTLDNVDNYAEVADALIVGSHFKTAGRWENALDPERIRALVGHLKSRRRWSYDDTRAANRKTESSHLRGNGSCSTSWANSHLRSVFRLPSGLNSAIREAGPWQTIRSIAWQTIRSIANRDRFEGKYFIP